ncbi:GNAT family N-acetyltransferase [Vibrio tetraodonis]|uniref:GNAT family N-acetyltransferase n=1 Tax=Vibrio tetraodonis TaxID=2231647 RepID=UPI000E0A3D02|nr:GNAT family N-acetyltransferase [Vibrio tetraodonis]
MEFKVAAYEDYERLASLQAQSWKMFYQGALEPEYLDLDILADRRVVWQTRLINPPYNQHVLLLEEGGLLCGFICAFGNHDYEKGTIIDALHIDDYYLGKGLGVKLVGHVAQWVKKHFPNNGIYVNVVKSNRRAITFCERLGGHFKQERTWNAPCGSQVPELIYSWNSPEELLESTSRLQNGALNLVKG